MGMTTDMTSIPEWTLGDRLRRIRRDAGLDQRAMASRLGVSNVRYANWESDYNRPRDLLDITARVEREFRVPQWWLLGIAGSTSQYVTHEDRYVTADEFALAA